MSANLSDSDQGHATLGISAAQSGKLSVTSLNSGICSWVLENISPTSYVYGLWWLEKQLYSCFSSHQKFSESMSLAMLSSLSYQSKLAYRNHTVLDQKHIKFQLHQNNIS